MSDPILLTQDHAGIRRVTINRANKLNALNRHVLEALAVAVEQARGDDAIRVLVLEGSGEKAFVAGADIAEMGAYDIVQAQNFARDGQSLMRAIESMGKPVIARIQGHALGGGLELALACHLRIASTQARLGQPEINLGLIPGFGGTQRLVRLCGRAVALELCLLGQPVEAARAHQLGLLTRVVEPARLDEEIDQVAQQLARSAPIAMAHILSTIIEGGECAIDQGLLLEQQAFALCFGSADAHEGTQAFLAKRTARFEGR